jgi:hypothetical protein
MLDPGGWTHRRRSTWAAAALATLALGVAIVCVLMVVSSGRPEEADTELLLKVHLAGTRNMHLHAVLDVFAAA